MKLTPAIRAHRILKHLDRFRLGPATNGGPPLAPSEETVGIYYNEPGSIATAVVVTSMGLHFGEGWDFVPYSEMETISPPGKSNDARRLLLGLSGGETKEVLVAGAPGRNTRDVYEFARYLQRVIADLRRAG